ncbi:MAG: DUF4349 domain-containing protein [Treponema sp.]|jgi:hypothetical protein|nr:DUF4349 domain-containing protein [Treponema sp.]
MAKKIFLPLLAVALFSFGCSRADKAFGGDAGVMYAEARLVSQMSAYDDSSTRWAGTGYNGEMVVAQEAAAFKDMSNLYGRADENSGSTASSEASTMADAVERKLVKRANISIRAENLDEADASVAALMEKHGAYSSLTEAQEDTSRRYSIRVPSSEYDAFLAGTSGMGRVLRRTETTEDATLRYYDLEGRLATKKELLKTFQSYLEKAKSIEEILSVEARLSDLHSEIDGTGRELRNLANRVDYATIDLTIFGPVTSMPNRGLTLGEKVKGLFAAFGGFLSTVAVVIVGIVIYGVPILLLLALFFWLFFGKIGLMKKLWRVAAGKKVSQK